MLVLRQSEVDRRKLLEPGRATVLPAAPAHPGEPGRLVPHADLAQLDPGAEQRGQIPDQRPEVNALLGGEGDRQLLPVPLPLRVAHFHQELVGAHSLDHLLAALLFGQADLLVQLQVFVVRATEHRLERRRLLDGLSDGAAGAAAALLAGHVSDRRYSSQVPAALDFDHDALLDLERIVLVRPDVVPFAGTLEPDFNGLSHYASVNAPIAANFSARRRTSLSGLSFRSSVRCRIRASRRASPAASGSTCPPPTGSLITSSITLSRNRSSAVILSASAARSRWLASFQRIAAHPSGEITEYTEFSSIRTRSATPRASAPPEPPSPITTAIQAVGNADISRIFRASAPDWPRSSAPSPGWAPGVSISVITAAPNLAASFISLSAFR